MAGDTMRRLEEMMHTLPPASEKKNRALFDMECVGENRKSGISYYKDAVTDVMYLRFCEMGGYGGSGGLTVMLDPESGLPLTYARYMEMAGEG